MGGKAGKGVGHWRQQERKGDGPRQLGEAGPPLMRQTAYGAEASGKLRGWGAEKPVIPLVPAWEEYDD